MNFEQTPRQIRWRIVAALGILSVILLIVDSTGNLDNIFAFLRDPLTVVLDWSATRANNVANIFAGPGDLQDAREQIATLELQIAELERENAELREFRNQNQLYVDLFNTAADAPELERILANVIGRDTSPVFRSLIIDKGSDDGVFVGMPVEAPRGLVGRIYRTTPQTAQVLLLIDNISGVSARLSTSRALGVAEGGGRGGTISLNWVDLEAQIETGDVVLTSGLNGTFPQDLVIGRVIDVQRSEAELFQSALIQTAVDFDTLEAVFVITSFEFIDTSIFDTPPESLP